MDYIKYHVKSLQRGYNADQYVVQNLMWSETYPINTLSNAILYKVLTLVTLTATRPEVYVFIMTIFLSNYYNALEETHNNMKSIKLKIYLGEYVIDCCAAILAYSEGLENSGVFTPKHLGYITIIVEDTSDYIFYL